MKKLITLFAALITSAALFAGTPAKDLLAGVYDFATQESSTWKIYDGYFKTIDVSSEEYVFTGSFIVKILVGNSRYDFTCTVKNGSDDFTVELSDMTSYACDKKGSKLPKGTINNTSANVASQYAAQMKDEINARIKGFKDIDAQYTKTVTSPAFVETASKSMTDLAFKKFAEANINGKPVEFDVILSSIDENLNPITKEPMELAYKAVASFKTNKIDPLGMTVSGGSLITIYSNNEKLVSAKKDSVYRVKGTAKVTALGSTSNRIWSYSVEEK